MPTTIFVCPFAMFGNPGTQHGAELIADAVREMLDDAAEESRPCRSVAFANQVTLTELPLATPGDVGAWRMRARAAAREALVAGHFLLWIGGNHLSVAPLYEELAAIPGACVAQFDAHLDVYHFDDVIEDETHGNFVRHLDPRPPIVNFGRRDLFLPTMETRKFYRHAVGPLEDRQTAIAAAKRAKRLCIDIDWDVLDPAFFPAVGDALPMGMSPVELLQIMKSLWSPRVCALSLSEFDPARDDGDRSLQLAVWLIEQVLLWRHEA
ncbi:MAG: arginase family protein [Gemmataceae bacterium]|nr:arginase family protein [Gemmataceae bacterium]